MTDYVDMLYDDHPFAEAHPDRLAAAARLHGARTPRTRGGRVLDLGCGLGGHLIPLAEHDPDGTYVGIDLSAPQIAEGQRIVDAAGLTNVTLLAGDIQDLPDLGRFDVIVCHGVYSWVPRETQLSLLAAIRRHLAADGVAYVSCNMLPGWYTRGAIRQTLLRLVPDDGDAAARLAASRELLALWSRGTADSRVAIDVALHEDLAMLDQASDAYLRYEHLAEVNSPVWFTDLVDDIEDAGLAYLGDADLAMHAPHPVVEAELQARGSRAEDVEQLRDVISHRMFRRNLLVHREAMVDRELHWRRLEGLWLTTQLVPPADLEPTDGAVAFSRRRSDRPAELVGRRGQAAAAALAASWPTPMAFQELCAVTARILGVDDAVPHRAELGRDLLALHLRGLLESRTHTPPVANTLAARPQASRVARALAAQRGYATNLRHERIDLRKTDVAVLTRLDGANDRDALVRALVDAARAGTIEVRVHDALTVDPAVFGPVVDMILELMRSGAFLLDAP